VDSKQRIILWYLPGLLSPNQEVCIFFTTAGIREYLNDSTKHDIRRGTAGIQRMLKRSVKIDKPMRTQTNWRINERNFIRKTAQQVLEPGAVNFSAGWLGQGHTVSFKLISCEGTHFISNQLPPFPLKPSLNLRTEIGSGSLKWVKISHDLERFINMTLSLINPDLYEMGLLMLRQLRQSEETKDIALQWQSVHTGISVICNRVSPSHRDSKGRPEWYDTLMNYSGGIGRHQHGRPRLLINDLGMDLDYSSGTVVSLCGTILDHEVKYWGNGDRVCYAHFMQESVRKRLQVPPARWVKREIYL
jgi:hypothetical protein